MTKTCMITGKGVITGNLVSHAKNRVKRRFLPNLHKRRLKNPVDGRPVTLWISARGLRTLKKWEREGHIIDLRLAKELMA